MTPRWFWYCNSTANPKLVNRELWGCGIGAAANGICPVAALMNQAIKISGHQVNTSYTAMGTMVAFVFGAQLYRFRKVINLSLAQAGYGLSFVFLTRAAAPVFDAALPWLDQVLATLVAGVIAIPYSGGLTYSLRQRSWSDAVAFGLVFVVYLGISAYCIVQPVR